MFTPRVMKSDVNETSVNLNSRGKSFQSDTDATLTPRVKDLRLGKN